MKNRGLYTAPYFPVGIHWSPYGFLEFMWSPCGFSYSGPTQICVFSWTPARLQLESKSTTWNPGSPPHGPTVACKNNARDQFRRVLEVVTLIFEEQMYSDTQKMQIGTINV
jgi:hypothetical protein